MEKFKLWVFKALRVTAFVSVWDNSLTFLSFSGCLFLPLSSLSDSSRLLLVSPSLSLSLALTLFENATCLWTEEQTAPILSTHKSSSGVSKLDRSFVRFFGGWQILSVWKGHSGLPLSGFYYNTDSTKFGTLCKNVNNSRIQSIANQLCSWPHVVTSFIQSYGSQSACDRFLSYFHFQQVSFDYSTASFCSCFNMFETCYWHQIQNKVVVESWWGMRLLSERGEALKRGVRWNTVLHACKSHPLERNMQSSSLKKINQLKQIIHILTFLVLLLSPHIIPEVINTCKLLL